MDPPQETPSPECWDRGLGSQNPTGYEVGRERILSHKSEFPATGICKLTSPPSYEVFRRCAEAQSPGRVCRVRQKGRPACDRTPYLNVDASYQPPGSNFVGH